MLLEMLVFVALFRNDELAMKLQPSRGACVVDGDVVVHPDCGSMKWLYYFSLVAGLLSYYMLICCIKNARTYPTNYARQDSAEDFSRLKLQRCTATWAGFSFPRIALQIHDRFCSGSSPRAGGS